jgi:hypothetical protein
MNWFPLYVGENRIGGCGNRLLDNVPVAIEGEVAEDLGELAEFSYASNDSFVAVKKYDVG